jgi:hypothetical protein
MSNETSFNKHNDINTFKSILDKMYVLSGHINLFECMIVYKNYINYDLNKIKPKEFRKLLSTLYELQHFTYEQLLNWYIQNYDLITELNIKISTETGFYNDLILFIKFSKYEVLINNTSH